MRVYLPVCGGQMATLGDILTDTVHLLWIVARLFLFPFSFFTFFVLFLVF